MKKLSLAQGLTAVGLVGACSAGGDGGGSGLRGMLGEGDTGGSFTTGGATSGTGGTVTGGTGGKANPAQGGSGGKTGGSNTGGTGSFNSGGGGKASGGATSSGGGSPLVGGTTGSGGSGGTPGDGGTGGTPSMDGSGGTGATGGTTATGGAPATGGTASTGGSSSATGGTPATGGSGGASASGCGGNTNGLLACWLFDEASGTTAADSSGNNHTLTLSGSAGCATLGSTGKAGNRLTLGKGTPLKNNCGGVASNANVDLGNLTAVTVSVWVKNESGAVSYAYRAGIVDFEGAFTLDWDLDNLGWYAGAGETAPAAPAGNAWHHLAATWSAGTGEVYLYLDGNEIGSGFNANTPASGAHQLLIGSVAGATSGFSGGIDNLRIYNRVLSGAEIDALVATP